MVHWFCLISWRLFDVTYFFVVQWFCLISQIVFDGWMSYFWKMSQCKMTFDFKINLDHSDVYFMVQWFVCPPPKGKGIYCFWCESCWHRRQRWRRRGTSLFAQYLMNRWVDFNLICKDVTFGHNEELIRFWWPWPYFQGLKLPILSQKVLVCTISHELVGRFQPDLYGYNIRTWWRADLVLVTLTYFSRSLWDQPNLSQEVLVCTISHEPAGGFKPDLHGYNMWTW